MSFASRRRMAYLLRIWQCTVENGKPEWRASLEDAHTGKRHGFPSVDALVAFLEQRSCQDATPPASGGAEGARSVPSCRVGDLPSARERERRTKNG